MKNIYYVVTICIVLIIIGVFSYNKASNQMDESLLNENNLSKNSSYEMVLEKKKPTVRLIEEKKVEQLKVLGQTKLGGMPDLPSGQKWPGWNNKPLSFLAQVNLGQLNQLNLENDLPPEGILYFFFDGSQEIWGSSIEEKDGWKVLYTSIESNELIKTEFPKNLIKDYRYSEMNMSFEVEDSYPNWENDVVQNSNLSEKAIANYIEYYYELNGENTVTKLLGYPNQIQGDMQIGCALIENDNSIDKKDWILLFQLDSEDKNGMMWGDAGRLYFWIKKEDLKNKNFDDVWMILQCY